MSDEVTIEMIKERQNEIRNDLEKMLATLEGKLRTDIMQNITSLLILGILEGRKTTEL
jgi:archaellum component FlaC